MIMMLIKYLKKTIRDIKENCDKDIILRDLDFIFYPEKNYEPEKTVSSFNNNFIQYKIIGNKDKNLSIEEYVDIIRPYLSDTINDYKTQGEWETHLIVAANFTSSKDSDETRIMHFKSDNIEIMMGNETDEIIEKLFGSLLHRYQKGLEELMRGSEFIFDSVDILY